MNDRDYDYRPRPSKKRRRKKGGSPVGLILGITAGAVVVLGLAVVLLRGGLGPSNPNVKPENLHKLQSGFTVAQIEAILGPGRPAVAADIYAVFGPENEHFPRENELRRPWQMNIPRGFVRAWENGSYVALVVFNQSPEQGGRELGKAYRDENGIIHVEYASLPEDQPGVINLTVDELVAEFTADPNGTTTKYRAKRLLVSGVVQQPAAGTGLTIRAANGRGAVHAQLPPQHIPVFAPKRPGEVIRFYGSLKGYLPTNRIVVLGECILDN